MGFGIHRVAGEAAAKRGPLRRGKWTKQGRGRQQMLQLIGDRGVCEASQAISDELSKLRRRTSLNKSYPRNQLHLSSELSQLGGSATVRHVSRQMKPPGHTDYGAMICFRTSSVRRFRGASATSIVFGGSAKFLKFGAPDRRRRQRPQTSMFPQEFGSPAAFVIPLQCTTNQSHRVECDVGLIGPKLGDKRTPYRTSNRRK
jgi:hypothetical protein